VRKGALVGVVVVESESTEKALKGTTFGRCVLRRARRAVCSGAAHLKTILELVIVQAKSCREKHNLE